MIVFNPADLARHDFQEGIGDRSAAIKEWSPGALGIYQREHRRLWVAEAKDPEQPVYQLVRFYPNGSAKISHRTAHGRDAWLAYNRAHRGASLFVDGVCVEAWERPEVNEGLARQLAERFTYPVKVAAEVPGIQRDFFGGTVYEYWGFDGERELRPDFDMGRS